LRKKNEKNCNSFLTSVVGAEPVEVHALSRLRYAYLRPGRVVVDRVLQAFVGFEREVLGAVLSFFFKKIFAQKKFSEKNKFFFQTFKKFLNEKFSLPKVSMGRGHAQVRRRESRDGRDNQRQNNSSLHFRLIEKFFFYFRVLISKID
jgi:hypothetical protein